MRGHQILINGFYFIVLPLTFKGITDLFSSFIIFFISAHPTFLDCYGMVSSPVLDTLEATTHLETWVVICNVV